MKKILLAVLLAATTLSGMANMTDQQIMKYVAEQQAKGTPQQEMIQYLLSQGVTPQQLQRLKQKWNKQNNNEQLEQTETVNGRMRKAKASAQASENTMQSADSLYMMPVEEGPKVFGRDIFRNTNVTFEPNMNIATPSNYILGTGDQVYIDIYGATQTTVDGTISPDGKITIENIGPVQLGGLSVEQATKRLRAKIASVYADSKITLSVGQTRTIQVNVMGEVQVPGTYTLSAFASIFHALYSAGGVSNIGSLRTIKLYRNNQLVTTADMYDYILNGQLSGDIRLQDNDVIVVGTYESLVNVSGKVKRPMYYEMKGSESLGKALDYAGGFAADAYSKTVRVHRKAEGEYQVLNLTSDNKYDVLAMDGDSISVDSIKVRYKNMVELKGAVFHEGMYQLNAQTNSVKGLLAIADGVTEDAYTQRAVLQRMRKDRTLETVPVDLQAILDGSAPDVTLQNEDVLIVPSLQSANESKTMTIYGEVMEEGVYAFAHNTTVQDFVLQAGGLTEKAMNGNLNIVVAHRDGTSQEVSIDDRTILLPYDQVYVHGKNKDRIGGTVTIEGEVWFEGPYTITSETQRVSDVLRMAGGLTDEAAPNGVYVLRMMTEEEMRLRRNKLDNDRYSSAYNTIARSQQVQGVTVLPITDSLMIERDLREDLYKVSVDLQKALKNPGCSADLVLRDGDRIVVERQLNTVRLVGAIPYQSTVPYVKGKRIAYYLRQGGIIPSYRNRKMTYIIDQNGQAQNCRRFSKVAPGSQVYLRERATDLTSAQKVSIITSAASALATAAAVVISIVK